jgi:predicted carbohydrate-binding protein with CBM5 and CBM33 domain
VTACRRTGVVAVVLGVAGMLSAFLAGPAGAHGATGNPVSRAVVCGPEGGSGARSKACLAAAAVSGAQALADWDNVRVADVGGRDRQVIPDGRLCSGGIDRFKGLDLARADWPATRLVSGAGFTFKYRASIPHRGAFRLYVTKNGYNPSHGLRWSDLEVRPFLAVTDPVLKNGSYVAGGRLPKGKTGRHLIYTIWQTSTTPDTYYSCSDVVFGGSGTGGGNAGGKISKAPTSAAPTKAAPTKAAPTGATPAKDVTLTPAAARDDAAGGRGNGILPLAAGGAGLLVLVLGATVVLVRRTGPGRHS